LAYLKAGVQFAFKTFEQTYADARSGVFVFGDSADFAARRGGFWQALDALPLSQFKTSNIAGFLQGLFRPTATLDLTVGLRYEQEHIPTGDIRPNTGWRSEEHTSEL